jgi:hypothetical protein
MISCTGRAEASSSHGESNSSRFAAAAHAWPRSKPAPLIVTTWSRDQPPAARSIGLTWRWCSIGSALTKPLLSLGPVIVITAWASRWS